MLALTTENKGCFHGDSCFASLAAWREGNWYLATRLVLTLHFPSPSTILSLYMSLTDHTLFYMPIDILTGRWFQPIDKETSWTCFIQHTKRKTERVRTNYESINFRLCVPIQKHLSHLFLGASIAPTHPIAFRRRLWHERNMLCSWMIMRVLLTDGILLNIVKRLHHHGWSWMATEIWKVQ
jgi:hypothetical protein